jgi:putative two-component system response regulator
VEARHRVLIVDDDAEGRLDHGRTLVAAGYECSLAGRCSEARALLGDGDFSLAICGLRISGESGLDLVREIRSEHPDTAVLMASGEDDPMIAEIASDNGAYGYMVTPLRPNQFLIDVANALYRRRLGQQNDRLRERLEQAVEERTSELRAVIEGLRLSEEETVHRLSQAVELRDVQTVGQIERIGDISALLASHLGLPRDRVELLRVAAPMHDVGKIGIADRILLKPGDLTEPERDEMKRHTEIGHYLLSSSKSELMGMAALVALTHHEWFDGAGYPRGLAGEEIPIEGRIVAVADVFDALISDRVYRPAFSLQEATETMKRGRGTQFDPAVLDALLENVEATMLIGRQPTGDAATSGGASRLDSPLPGPLAAAGVRQPERQEASREPGKGVEEANENAAPSRDRQDRPGSVEQAGDPRGDGLRL